MADIEHDIDLYIDNCATYDDINDFITEKRIKKMSGLSIIHQNVASLRNKWEIFKYILEDKGAINDIDIIVLTEISIKDNENSIYQLKGFSSLSYNRERQKGGGICMLYRSNIDLDEIWKGKNSKTGHEGLHVEVNINTKKVSIIAVYRPPDFNSDLYIEEISNYLRQIDKSLDLMIIGDINIDIKNNKCEQVNRYKNVMAENGLENCIFGYTREALRKDVYTRSSIDHIYIRTCEDLISSIIHTHASDHYMTGIVVGYDNNVNTNTRNKNTDKPNVEWRYKENIIIRELNNIDWEELAEKSSVISGTNSFYINILNEFNKVYESAACKRERIASKRIDKKWITIEIKNDIKARDVAFKKWKGSPTNENYRNIYRVLRNKVNAKIIKQKNIYTRGEIDSVKNCIKKTWHKINELIGRKGRESIEGKVAKHFKELFTWNEILNSFAEEFTQGVEGVIHECNSLTSDVTLQYVNHSMFLPKATTVEISKIIENLKVNKAPGMDNIRAKDIIYCKEKIVSVITRFVNASISEGIVPADLKKSLVKPIFKQGKQSNFSNYRPIAILSVVDKILETYVLNHLNRYLGDHLLINKYQYGFQKGKSTTTLLSDFNEFVKNKLDSNKIVLVLFIDYKKAFDTINHDKLIEFLDKIGVRGKINKWFSDYLTNRKIIVKLNNQASEEKEVKYGVPQGSVLGPVLYSIYVNALFGCAKVCRMYMYADDTAMLSVHHSIDTATNNLQYEYNNILRWSHDNGLRINSSKTKVLCITTAKRNISNIRIKSHLDDCLHVGAYRTNDCGCPVLEEVKTFRYLGMVIDNRFLWTSHIEGICKKLRGCLAQFYRLKQFLGFDTLKTVYYALVHSIIHYGILCYGNTSAVHIQKIEAVHKKIIKMISSKQMIDAIDKNKKNVYGNTRTLTIKKLYKYQIIIQNYYSIVMNIQPLNSHDLRYVALRRRRTNNRYGERLMEVAIPEIFNSIPVELHHLEGIGVVKKRVKDWLIDDVISQ